MADLQAEMRKKEQRWTASNSRLRDRIEQLETENSELKDEIKVLEKRRLEVWQEKEALSMASKVRKKTLGNHGNRSEVFHTSHFISQRPIR